MKVLAGELITENIRLNFNFDFDREATKPLPCTITLFDFNTSASVLLGMSDIPTLAQGFIAHSQNISAVSRMQEITEVQIKLPFSARDCHIRIKENVCLFPSRGKIDSAYPIKVSYSAMNKIINALNQVKPSNTPVKQVPEPLF